MDTHTPKHRDAERAPLDLASHGFGAPWTDYSSRAVDAPPVHPSGLCAGSHRQPEPIGGFYGYGRGIAAELARYHRAHGTRSEVGSMAAGVGVAFFMVAALLGGLGLFVQAVLARCGA